MGTTRRDAMALGLALAGQGLVAGCSNGRPTGDGVVPAAACGPWGRGPDGQRQADRGDGTFLNPILAGDHPDPSIIKDGDAYYLTFSSFDAYPGLVIWQSQDLVNWQPLAPALFTPIGSVWAPDLIRHEGRYFC